MNRDNKVVTENQKMKSLQNTCYWKSAESSAEHLYLRGYHNKTIFNTTGVKIIKHNISEHWC